MNRLTDLACITLIFGLIIIIIFHRMISESPEIPMLFAMIFSGCCLFMMWVFQQISKRKAAKLSPLLQKIKDEYTQ